MTHETERNSNDGQSGRIVVGVTSSAAGRRALRWAFNLAHTRGLSLDVITAFAGDADPAHGASHADALAIQGAVVFEEIGLLRYDHPVYCDAVKGDPVDVLCNRAIGASMLVVGRGRHTVRRKSGTSVSDACVDRAPCAVVIVRGDLAPGDL